MFGWGPAARPALTVAPPIDPGDLHWLREQLAGRDLTIRCQHTRIAVLERDNAILRHQVSRLLAEREAARRC